MEKDYLVVVVSVVFTGFVGCDLPDQTVTGDCAHVVGGSVLCAFTSVPNSENETGPSIGDDSGVAELDAPNGDTGSEEEGADERSGDTGGEDDGTVGGEEPTPNSIGIWISATEIMALPNTGPEFSAVKSYADKPYQEPDLSNQDDDANVATMARALMYVRTAEGVYRDQVVRALDTIATKNTEVGGRTLALGRELMAYVISADLIELESLPVLDSSGHELRKTFSDKLRALLDVELEGKTLVSTHEGRPNNWGTHAGASRMAIYAYLGDDAKLQDAAMILKSWLGDPDAGPNKFDFGSLGWQCDPKKPSGLNPETCAANPKLANVMPEDERRCSESFVDPPCKTNYTWGALQGILAQAVILHRKGYPVWTWMNSGIKRAVMWHYTANFSGGGAFPAASDDAWQIPVFNFYYCADLPKSGSAPGKNVGFTQWTHASNPACQ